MDARPIVGSVPANGTAAKAIELSGGGIIVEPESPNAMAAVVQDLYNNPILRAKLGNQGRQFAVENYSLEQALDRYEGLFSDIVANRASSEGILPKFNVSKG